MDLGRNRYYQQIPSIIGIAELEQINKRQKEEEEENNINYYFNPLFNPNQSQKPLITHFQRQLSKNSQQNGNFWGQEEDGQEGQTRSLLFELANDTGKLAKLFPKIGPKSSKFN
ncbi:unnamed protein product [Meloidogyne enterolobii]|uniref:Uncharacterized protein n=1 Tax=Meloidogyne enterolobii TaxID=390850 RepID=A0ACB0XL48_MELEN